MELALKLCDRARALVCTPVDVDVPLLLDLAIGQPALHQARTAQFAQDYIGFGPVDVGTVVPATLDLSPSTRPGSKSRLRASPALNWRGVAERPRADYRAGREAEFTRRICFSREATVPRGRRQPSSSPSDLAMAPVCGADGPPGVSCYLHRLDLGGTSAGR